MRNTRKSRARNAPGGNDFGADLPAEARVAIEGNRPSGNGKLVAQGHGNATEGSGVEVPSLLLGGTGSGFPLSLSLRDDSNLDGPGMTSLPQSAAVRGQAMPGVQRALHAGAFPSATNPHGGSSKTTMQSRRQPPSAKRPRVPDSSEQPPPCPNGQLQDQREKSNQHELDVARLLRGKRVPGSGARGVVGDVMAEPLLVECKRTTLRVRPLDNNELEKIAHEAASEGLTPAMAFRFDAIKPGVERDWVLVPARVLAALLRERLYLAEHGVAGKPKP